MEKTTRGKIMHIQEFPKHIGHPARLARILGEHKAYARFSAVTGTKSESVLNLALMEGRADILALDIVCRRVLNLGCW